MAIAPVAGEQGIDKAQPAKIPQGFRQLRRSDPAHRRAQQGPQRHCDQRGDAHLPPGSRRRAPSPSQTASSRAQNAAST
jgi:hypothetical protein